MGDQQTNARWLETLKRERRAKEKWQGKYLAPAELQAEEKQLRSDAAALNENIVGVGKNPNRPHGTLSERDASELRLKAFADDGPPQAEVAPRPVSSYEAARRKVSEEVSRSRPRSHRYTGDLSTASMLRDIGPSLYAGMNPSYAITKDHYSSSSHTTHFFDTSKGWGEKVDKEHHMKLDVMLAHADKCLQLGEKPFKSGGMKLSGK